LFQQGVSSEQLGQDVDIDGKRLIVLIGIIPSRMMRSACSWDTAHFSKKGGTKKYQSPRCVT
jgi:hypothetical protein